MIAIIDYGASNLRSVQNALAKIHQASNVVTKPEQLADAEKVILPGVGSAGDAMARLREAGFAEIIPKLSVPVLGICLGMQLFSEFSEEDQTACLGIISGRVRKISGDVKVPQMGWNTVEFLKPSPLFQGLTSNDFFYFVHSFYFDAPDAVTIAETSYGIAFPSAVQLRNFYGVQFHPEKSGDAGLQLLRNFCEVC